MTALALYDGGVLCAVAGAIAVLFADFAYWYHRHRDYGFDKVSYERGVEYGLFWARLKGDPSPIEQAFHADLVDALVAAARAKGRGVTVVGPHTCAKCDPRWHPAREDWVDVIVSAAAEAS